MTQLILQMAMRDALDSMDLKRGDAVEALARYEAMSLSQYLTFVGSPAKDPTGARKVHIHVMGLTPAMASNLFVATGKTQEAWLKVLDDEI